MRLPFPIRLKGVFGIPPKTRQASAERYVSPGDMSMLYAASGDIDEPFAWLKKADEQRDGLAGLVQSCSRVRSAALPTAVSSSSWDE